MTTCTAPWMRYSEAVEKPISACRDLAKNEASKKLQKNSDMIRIAKLTFGGGVSRILFCPMMMLCLDGEVARSNLDHDTLRSQARPAQKSNFTRMMAMTMPVISAARHTGTRYLVFLMPTAPR
jgi:hypothetical protein